MRIVLSDSFFRLLAMLPSANVVEPSVVEDVVTDPEALTVRQIEHPSPKRGDLRLAPVGTSENLGILPGGVIAGMLTPHG